MAFLIIFRKQVKKWCAEIRIDGIKIHLGLFDTIEEAAEGS